METMAIDPESAARLLQAWLAAEVEPLVGARIDHDQLAAAVNRLAHHARVLDERAADVDATPEAALLARGYARGLQDAAYLASFTMPPSRGR